jgi:hypothetical protein
MASIILSAAGTAAGAATGMPYAAAIGARLGRMVGGMVDQSAFGKGNKVRHGQSARLSELVVQTSTYGKMIPIVYGTVRIAGNIIWALPIKEVATTSTSSSSAGGGKGGGKVTQTSTNYSYYTTLAIAICEGEINNLQRIWADAKQLDLSQYTVRFYTGSEGQLPDPFIQSCEGVENTPAYRGLAYVVIEDFPLADYGNRIPNFTFEVTKRAFDNDYGDDNVEALVRGVVMIPGAGEFVYDTEIVQKISGESVDGQWVQQGNQSAVNMHNQQGKANAQVALSQLQEICPNVEWVSVVVAWFGDSLDIATCSVMPGVEYKVGAVTTPNDWGVAGYDRASARQITLEEGSAIYGGTPDDESLLRYVQELRSRGFKVVFYPILFMDVEGKPWRGQLTGSAGEVTSFFTKTAGYNAFISHYANLLSDKVDAFVIGSELKGLTSITSAAGVYPAVSQLVSLASTVKPLLASGVKLTYAADWSEYHHAAGGWYHMDPLWASPNIDMIGIDAYFPLTDADSSVYDIDQLKHGWTSGEGYEWYYSDAERTVQTPLTEAYAWKNIEWFWKHAHVNPGGGITAWVPESKKIWFMEYGFPSVDCSSNQPNVFFDPNSVNGGFPYKSKGSVDFRAQRAAIAATELQWRDSDMIERMFLWCWDARPYPHWPDMRSVWADGGLWQYGHWVQGKFGISSLPAVVNALVARAGLDTVDVAGLSTQLEGYVIDSPRSVRASLETLQHAYFFDCVESGDVLRFVHRGDMQDIHIDASELVQFEGGGESGCKITRQQEIELPRRLNIVYLNRLLNYQATTQYAQREVTESNEIETLDLPIVLSDTVAKSIVETSLKELWASRTAYEFHLPMRYACIEPADSIVLNMGAMQHRLRVLSTHFGGAGIMRIRAVAEVGGLYDNTTRVDDESLLVPGSLLIPLTRIEMFELPTLPGETGDASYLRIACAGTAEGWKGSVIYRSDDGGADYGRFATSMGAAAMGTTATMLASGSTTVIDQKNTLDVLLLGDAELHSTSELAMLNGRNAALVGQEIIQFQYAELISAGKYRLSGLLRGRLGTDWAVSGHTAGERFILLNQAVEKQVVASQLIGLSRLYKAVTLGQSVAAVEPVSYTHQGIGFKPLSPVQVRAVRNVGGDVNLSWVRRSRIDADWRDHVDVPLAEATELYDVEILDGAAVKRSFFALSSPVVTYSAAQQIADFGAPQSSISVRVYQLSNRVGRGYGANATV